MFAYKPEDEEMRFADFGSGEIEATTIESAPVYTNQTMKTDAATSGNSLQVGA